MDHALRAAVEATITEATERRAEIETRRSVGGGSINQATLLILRDGRRAFLKTHRSPPPRFFECEAAGLRALGAARCLRVPEVYGASSEPTPFLVMEAIDAGPRSTASPPPGFFERFGRSFALLHRLTNHDRCGFDHDNYIGATPQPNAWNDDWIAFWRERRLGHQLRLARHGGVSDPQLERLGDRLLDRLDDLLGGVDEPASLLHGDLWGGNYLCDEEGAPVLVDPAVYYGHREADLAMTRLFGGFQPAFYRAYEEAWPLADGAEVRGSVYELYHLLNHLNLFGGGYRQGCLEILRRLVG